ncbi:MAG: DUF4266 domain-containing protein [Ketobacteraceae bacterium]|nr:DUF4266 domain-containing protein [Ketobacteraceae bacterium]
MALWLMLWLALPLVSGCSYEKVRPWERGRLANPVMIRDANPAQALLEQHTYSSKETTSGGYSAGAGGCGCN